MIEDPPPIGPAPRLGARTKGRARVLVDEIRIGRFLYPEAITWRPRTRGDCDGVPRPCPYAGCRYHLGIDVSTIGTLTQNLPVEPWDLEWSCALDMAEHDGLTLEQVAHVLGLSRERIRQIENKAAAKARAAAARMGFDADALFPIAAPEEDPP